MVVRARDRYLIKGSGAMNLMDCVFIIYGYYFNKIFPSEGFHVEWKSVNHDVFNTVW